MILEALRKTRRAIAGCFVLSAVACHPGELETAGDSDLVVTIRADGADFSGRKTYGMPNALIDLERLGEVGSSTNPADLPVVGGDLDAFILQSVADEMTALGYRRVVEGEEDPDLFVLAGGSITEEWDSYEDSEVYCWSWGGKLTCIETPPEEYLVVYRVGTVAIQISDATMPRPGDAVIYPVMWTAALNGVVSGGSNRDRVGRAIDQAFSQSPYLNPSSTANP